MLTFHQLYNHRFIKRLISVLRIVLPVAILYYLFTLVKIEELVASFRTADKTYLLLGVMLTFPAIWLQFLKWKRITNGLLSGYSSIVVWKSLLVGYAFGVATPVRAGEIPGRSYGLKNDTLTSVSMAVALDKTYNLAAILVVGSSLAAFYLKFTTELSGWLLLFFPLVVLIMLYSTFLVLRGKNLGNRPVIRTLRKLKFLDKVKVAFNKSRRMDGAFHSGQLILSLFVFFAYSFQFVLYVLAFEPQANIFEVYSAIGTLYYIKSFIGFLAIADLGIRESSAVYLLGAFGIGAASALNASLLIFTTNILLPAAFGAIILIKKG